MKILKFEGSSQNQQEAILDLFKQHAPEVFSENKIDIKQLRATLGEEVLADAERYGLNWAGKMDCFRTIQETTTNTIKPVREESVDFDNTENLFIEGDNLEVLKVLQKSYYGKIKMIYIDPPYNTGNDFIYNDKFSRNKREYLEDIGAIDREGNVVNAGLYTQNTKDSGHFHSDWLNMMYPRLFLAKNLLRQDGVIFVSIDDNEVHNLRTVMNEIFGEENFVAQIIWHSKYTVANDTRYTSQQHEYVVAFAKSKGSIEKLRLPRTKEMDDRYSNPDNDPRGAWKATPLHAKSGKGESYIFTFRNGIKWSAPSGRFPRYSQASLQRLDEEDRLWFGKDNTTTPSVKTYLIELEDERVSGDVWSYEEVGHTHSSNEELAAILGKGIFDNPKPTKLIIKMLQLSTDKNDVVVDFFAGSGTTAHAVMQLNAQDGGSRKYVCVQLPEKCKPETEAAKAGFVTIADIAKERIRRAGKRIQEDNPDQKIDVGFKMFKIDESNFKIWNTHVTSVEQLEQQMIEMFDNVQPGATKEAMMYELILKSGKELNVAIEEKTAGGEKYFRINDGSLVICLADKLSKELFTGILVEKPKKIIVLDKSFGNDDQLKTNLLLQAEGAGVDEVRVI